MGHNGLTHKRINTQMRKCADEALHARPTFPHPRFVHPHTVHPRSTPTSPRALKLQSKGEGLVSGVDGPGEAFFTLFINLFNKNPQKFSRAAHRLRRSATRQARDGRKKFTPILKIPITTSSIS